MICNMKPVREQQAHKQVSKEWSGSYRAKRGKDLMPVFACCTKGKNVYPLERL